jgi:GAF domain-containing protein
MQRFFLDSARRLKEILAEDEIRDALKYLNSLTSFRFTALYRFDQDILSNRVFFDRKNPEVTTTENIPLQASYCVYVRDRRSAVSVADSVLDEQVADHPKRNTIRSYCGVPLVDESGQMFGSVCHFDFEPHPSHEVDVRLLEEVAFLLPRAGLAAA